jgi:hypothetical protein
MEAVMRVLLCSFIGLVLVVYLSASPALADREVVVKPLDSSTPTVIGPGAVANTPLSCTTGNLNAAAFAIVGFAAPPEEYKLVFDPTMGCSACSTGLAINTIHIMMRTAQACDVVMAVDVEEVSDADPACPGTSPGVEVCNSGPYTVNLPAGGIWDVAIPITCDCLTMARLYLLSFEYLSSSCLPEPDLITDATPTACTSWNNFGSGWFDLVTAFGFPGNLSFYADAECCSPPVPVETKTWGAIKELYDN